MAAIGRHFLKRLPSAWDVFTFRARQKYLHSPDGIVLGMHKPCFFA